MKSLTAELAALGGRLPAYPEPPPIAALAQEIAVYVGRRSDQTVRATNPSTVFEMELDAEVQELTRQYDDLQTAVYDYLARHRAAAKLRTRVLYALFGVTIGLCGLVTWSAWHPPVPLGLSEQLTLGMAQGVALDAPPAEKDTSAVAVTDTTASAASSPATASAATSINPTALSVSTSSSTSIVPSSILVQITKTPPVLKLKSASPSSAPPKKNEKEAIKGVDPKDTSILAVEDNSQDKAEARDPLPSATQSVKIVDASSVKKVVDPVSIKSHPVTEIGTQPTRPDSTGDKPRKKNAEASKPADEARSTPPSNERGSANTEATTKPDTDDAAKPSRKDQYGSSGVVTIMPSGVVVFDAKTKSQKLVTIGAKMPDGSTLKGVDAKASRIKTDKGEVEYE